MLSGISPWAKDTAAQARLYRPSNPIKETFLGNNMVYHMNKRAYELLALLVRGLFDRSR